MKKKEKSGLGEYLLRTHFKNEKLAGPIVTAFHSIAEAVNKKEKQWMGDSLESLFALFACHIKTKSIILEGLTVLVLVASNAEILKSMKFANPEFNTILMDILKAHLEAPVVLGKVIDLLFQLVTDASCKDLLKVSVLEELQTMHKDGKFKAIPKSGSKPEAVIDRLSK